ncbi:hypothetical protein KEM54_003759, partial [Ascosphaera aggregata]
RPTITGGGVAVAVAMAAYDDAAGVTNAEKLKYLERFSSILPKGRAGAYPVEARP